VSARASARATTRENLHARLQATESPCCGIRPVLARAPRSNARWHSVGPARRPRRLPAARTKSTPVTPCAVARAWPGPPARPQHGRPRLARCLHSRNRRATSSATAGPRPVRCLHSRNRRATTADRRNRRVATTQATRRKASYNLCRNTAPDGTEDHEGAVMLEDANTPLRRGSNTDGLRRTASLAWTSSWRRVDAAGVKQAPHCASVHCCEVRAQARNLCRNRGSRWPAAAREDI
jgi:hypothetical protein